MIRSGDATIFMATDTTAEPSIGELRFIARLQPSKLPLEYPFGSVSTTGGSSSAVEGSDVFVVNGQTRSKFYSSERFIDDYVHCVYRDSDAVHACMLLNSYSYERSSGGPFFRDINTNNAGDSTNLYFYMNSGHVQTETYRQGLHGPYALSFSRSGIPTGKTMDTTFFKDLGISGYVAPSGRGTVTGTATGGSSGLQKVLHWCKFSIARCLQHIHALPHPPPSYSTFERRTTEPNPLTHLQTTPPTNTGSTHPPRVPLLPPP